MRGADGGAGGHHGGGANFKNLRDMGRRAGAPGGDGACHHFHVGTAEIGIHAKARLAFIEARDLFGNALTKRTAQPIPELDFGAALGAHGRCHEGGREQTRCSQQNVTTLHESSPFLLRLLPDTEALLQVKDGFAKLVFRPLSPPLAGQAGPGPRHRSEARACCGARAHLRALRPIPRGANTQVPPHANQRRWAGRGPGRG